MSSLSGSEVLAALGEQEEYQQGTPSVLLPGGGYIMNLEVEEYNVGDYPSQLNRPLDPEVLDDEGDPILQGGSPYANLRLTVAEGPFEENHIRPRIWITPGKGKNISWINWAIKSITGKAPDTSVLQEYGIEISGGTPEEVQASFREGFYKLGYFAEGNMEPRASFMQKYTRIDTWDGRQVVAILGTEDREYTDRETGEKTTRTFNRVLGFYPLSHDKKGAKWVRNSEHPRQEEEFAEMAVASA